MILSHDKRTRYLVLAGIFGVSLAAIRFGSHLDTPIRSTPMVHVVNPIVDLGALGPRTTRSVEFQILNKGSKRLVINPLENACQCDGSPKPTTIIPPNAEAKLIVSIEPRFAVGLNEYSAHFTTNDPDHPLLKLTVRAILPSSTDEVSSIDAKEDRSLSILIPN